MFRRSAKETIFEYLSFIGGLAIIIGAYVFIGLKTNEVVKKTEECLSILHKMREELNLNGIYDPDLYDPNFERRYIRECVKEKMEGKKKEKDI